MIKKILLLLSLPILLVATQENLSLKIEEPSNFYNYFRSGGFGLYCDDEFLAGTNVGLGTRYRNNHMGYGFSANLTYIGLCPYFSIRGESLYYLQQTPNSYFVGASIEVGHHYSDYVEWRFLARGEAMIGKEFINRADKKCFAYLGIDPFFLLIEDSITPIISLNFGWGF